MKIREIDHIGIVVKNLEESLARWKELFGFENYEIEDMRERGVRLVHLEMKKGPSLELVSPLAEDSPIAKFLQERGEGIHHFSFKVEDIEEVMAALKKRGIQFIQDEPQKGGRGSLIAFIHPKSLSGVLLELKQEAKVNEKS